MHLLALQATPREPPLQLDEWLATFQAASDKEAGPSRQATTCWMSDR